VGSKESKETKKSTKISEIDKFENKFQKIHTSEKDSENIFNN